MQARSRYSFKILGFICKIYTSLVFNIFPNTFYFLFIIIINIYNRCFFAKPYVDIHKYHQFISIYCTNNIFYVYHDVTEVGNQSRARLSGLKLLQPFSYQQENSGEGIKNKVHTLEGRSGAGENLRSCEIFCNNVNAVPIQNAVFISP